ncbi:unnamed protein product [Penicillium glandicola]
MAFSRNERYDYIGTGWLIADDVIVTAGHCLYDSNGGYLKSIKAYIGYQGPEETALKRNQCQIRLGQIAVLPAEYIKTSHTVHDVGFIKLDRPFDDVQPFRPQDTPRSASGIRLGVVGYPGDINSGNDMFEHWDQTEIDLSKNGYLSYHIDTEVGESGSPVLRQLSEEEIAPIGVHTDGGSPNSGSAIGPFGNLFSEYTTALNIKQTQKLPPGSRKVAATEVQGTRNLEYISLPAHSVPVGHPGKQSGQGSRSKSPISGKKTRSLWEPRPHTEAAKTIRALQGVRSIDPGEEAARYSEAARVVRELEFGFNKKGKAESKPVQSKDEKAAEMVIEKIKQFVEENGSFPLPKANLNYEKIHREKGKHLKHSEMCTQRPNSLPPGQYKETGAPGESHDELLRQAMEKLNTDQDIKTTFFVNFPPVLTGGSREKITAVVDNVRDWQCWVYGLSMAKVQQQINAGKLAAGPNAVDEAKRSTYKNMVFDYVMRSCNWIAQTYDEVQSKNIECSKLELHTTLLKHVLEGFSVPGNIMGKLHKALDSISEGIISVAKENTSQSMQYFIMLTRYEYEAALDKIQPVIRVISFRTDATLNTYNLNKSSYRSATFKFVFHQYQCDFNDKLYGQIKSHLDQRVQKTGREILEMTASEINLPVDAVFKESMNRPRRELSKQSALVNGDGLIYDHIVHSLSLATDKEFASEDSESVRSDILGAEPFDAGVAALIGTRLALQGQQAIKDMSIDSQEAAISRFPQYWQLVGSMVFKQLFSVSPPASPPFPQIVVEPNNKFLEQKTAIPPALRFHDAEQSLTQELQTNVKARKVVEGNNQSLQFALDEAKTKAESQKTKIDEMTNIIAVLQGLKVIPTGSLDERNALELQLKGLRDRAEQLKKDLEKAIQDGGKKEVESATLTQSLKSQLEISEATRKTLEAEVDRLRNRLLEVNPLLSTADSGEIDLNANLNRELPSLQSSQSQEYHPPFSADVQYMVGLTELQYNGQNPGFDLVGTTTQSALTLNNTRVTQLQAFKSRWLAHKPSPHLWAHQTIIQSHVDPSHFTAETKTLTTAHGATRFADMAKVDIHLYINGINCNPEIPGPLTIQPSVISKEQDNFKWTAQTDMQWLLGLRLAYFMIDPAGTEKVHVSYIHHDDEHPGPSQTVSFPANTFTQTPKIFLGLHAFSATADLAKRFKGSVGKVDKDSVEIVMEKTGFVFVHYICIAVQID